MTPDTESKSEGSSGTPSTPTGNGDSAHWWRIIAIWAILSIVFDVVWLYAVGPHVPPGRMTDTANGAAFDFNVLIVMAAPVMLAVWVYMVYAIVTFRSSRGGPDPVGGEQAHGNRGGQLPSSRGSPDEGHQRRGRGHHLR